ncbi:MAG: TetR/AcrR family transcriptional regulator [Oscillospiraceae bacterium]|nr:TetR/AcrR family transcriptional regulator [Oscillospiraceae bacterium]
MQKAKPLEHFLHLASEKQQNIINAALYAFGKNGYKKASVADIAAGAGISKAMIFHYFGCKKELYLYLIHFCADAIASGVIKELDTSETDFFKRIRAISELKLKAISNYPDMMIFMESMFFEADPEVEPEIKKIMSVSKLSFNIQPYFEGIDFSRFKEGVNPELVTRLLLYYTTGRMNEMPHGKSLDIVLLMREFDECIELFRKNFYRRADEGSI